MTHTTPATIEFLREIMPNRLIRWTLFVLFWGMIGLFSSLHWWFINVYFQGVYEGFWQVLRVKIVVWILWGLLTPLILRFGASVPVTKKNWLTHVPLHVVLAFAIGIAYSALYAIALIVNLGDPVNATTLPNMFQFVLSIHMTFFVLAAAATVFVEHGFSYLRDVRRRELRESQLESRLAQAQWQNLRAQLNPHFLFNVLNTSASQLLGGKQEEAHETLVKMSALLRMSLEHSESQFTSLKKEIQFARHYLELIRSRFPDRLAIHFTLPADTEEATVPTLVLQPLVENAVKHGINRSSESGEIFISAQRVQGRLILMVKNMGAVEEQGNASANGTGVGLKNLRERLVHLYKDEATLNLSVNGNAEAIATVELPFEVYDDEH